MHCRRNRPDESPHQRLQPGASIAGEAPVATRVRAEPDADADQYFCSQSRGGSDDLRELLKQPEIKKLKIIITLL